MEARDLLVEPFVALFGPSSPSTLPKIASAGPSHLDPAGLVGLDIVVDDRKFPD